MYATTQRHPLTYSDSFRWSARFGGVILFVAWLALVIEELARSDFRTLSIESFCQAAALAIVFLGYAVGWREELLGGMFSLFGTAAYFLIVVLTTNVLPGIEAAWFAAPGVLYLLAWQCSGRNVHAISRRHWA
jgi:hypothetical protein